MSEHKPESITAEMAKNAHHSANLELGGAALGAGFGAIMASSKNLKGGSFFGKVTDIGLIGWMIGWVVSLWSERSANHNTAVKFDGKMARLEAENKFLKDAVEHMVDVTDNHADKLKSERSHDCGCHLKH